MKVYPDNQLVRKFVILNTEAKNLLFEECQKALNQKKDNSLQFLLGWPALVEYLGVGELAFFPKFKNQEKIFSTVVEVLKLDSDKEVIVYLYDQIFVECLTQVKELSISSPQFLMEKIKERQNNPLFCLIEDPFAATLAYYETRLLNNSSDTMHDLTLYLAWDRVCVFLGMLFDTGSLKIQHGLEILIDCLVESFQHITENGKTIPSLFRLMEALYAFQMKEENLPTYSEEDWEILSKSVMGLQSRNVLSDANYIDAGLAYTQDVNPAILKFLTFDSEEKVRTRLSLADFILIKLKKEIPGWQYMLRPLEIVSIKDNGQTGYSSTLINFKDH